jgi:CheY-like chemotaxis protein
LIVEDDDDTRVVLEETLQDLGHVVAAANDGATALQLATELCPEVAIVDIGLPTMDGYEVAKRLRSSPGSAGELKLIALSGYGREEDRLLSEEAGFDVHLVKPASVDVIAELCRRK